ncbi:flagellar brake domain-containing protein [Paenibacillus sp. HN-1]|uniref:flagellar brake protein n=1 Tax=Paenibacillus TaxID=44249 RepID=UPI001CA98902|nr:MULTISPECIES: flagellar brake domain-containing protein [Paenibacillus]MBY9081632.1 flagellar brake domain-containing protein [Paenibacillus sp. CGMCC 1.18879]MBY9083501.1 flagellar brake domain-containing protein [Paenibacillus sinensis]
MYPKINDHLYIRIASSDASEEEIEYRSRIAEMEEESFLIEIPMGENTGRLKKLHIGDELSVYFLTGEGVKNYFYTHVLGFKEDVIRMVRIRKPDEDSIVKIQRRSFLRVSGELELACKTQDGKRFLVRTEDVSGGGLSFWTDGNYKLNVGDHLQCWLLIPYRSGAGEHAGFGAEIVRMKELENGRDLVMVKFNNISDGERQKIIRYCFERQFDFRNR